MKFHGIDREISGGRSHYYPFLTIVRFPLALWVIAHHLLDDGFIVWDTLPRVIKGFVYSGTFAVGAFFVISGFVIAQSLSHNSSRFQFYRRRILYLVPLFLYTTIVAFSHNPIDRKYLLGNILGLNVFRLDSAWFSLNGPAWSVSLELLFYVLSPFWVPRILFIRRAKVLLVTFLLLAICLPLIFRLVMEDVLLFHIFYHGPLSNFLAFSMGILIFSLKLRGEVLSHLMSTFAMTFFFLILLIDFYFYREFHPWVMFGGLGYLLGIVLILYGVAEKRETKGSLLENVLIKCGECSFVLYITQWMYLGVLRAELTTIGSTFMFFVILLASIALITMLCISVYSGLVYPISRIDNWRSISWPSSRMLVGILSLSILTLFSIIQPRYFAPIEGVQPKLLFSELDSIDTNRMLATFKIRNASSNSIYVKKCQLFFKEPLAKTQMEEWTQFVVSVEGNVAGNTTVFFDYGLPRDPSNTPSRTKLSIISYCY